MLGALSSALSGIASAHTRVAVASHNVANLLTEDFRPLRSHQSSRATGGSVADVVQADQPEPVSVAREFVDAELASVQARSSARLIKVELDLVGGLLDILS